MRVFGLAGSLRKGSYNRALLRAAVRLAPEVPEIRASYSNALTNYGAALGSRREYREAVKYFEQALRVKPDNENARRNLTYAQQLMMAAGAPPS